MFSQSYDAVSPKVKVRKIREDLCMDIGGLPKVRSLFASTLGLDIKRKDASADRDASGHGGYQNPEKPKHLTQEQEDEALNKLNELPAFKTAGLRAEIRRAPGEITHAVVLDKNNQVVRHLPYEQVIEAYLNRNNDHNPSGRLLNRAA